MQDILILRSIFGLLNISSSNIFIKLKLMKLQYLSKKTLFDRILLHNWKLQYLLQIYNPLEAGKVFNKPTPRK